MTPYYRYFGVICLVLCISGLLLTHIKLISFSVRPFWPQPNSTAKNQRKLCSFPVFKEYLTTRSDGVVSGDGNWSRTLNGKLDRFHSDICSFVHGLRFPQDELLQCLQRKNISYIVLAGDSNAIRMFGALLATLQGNNLTEKSRLNCKPSKLDQSPGHGISKMYYLTNNITTETDILTHDRDCSGCANQQFLCIGSSRFFTGALTVEFLSLEFTIDAEVSSFHIFTKCAENIRKSLGHLPCWSSISSQQFILKEYFAMRQPDLMIIFGNGHDSARYTLKEHAMNLEYFANLLDIYLPPTTSVVWTSKPGEYNEKMWGIFKNYKYERNKITLSEWLVAANRLMYDKMKTRFLDHNKPLMFLDLFSMSLPVLRDWNIDGYHMHSEWYSHIISYILQTFCNS